MAKVYVVMKERRSPICSFPQYPHEVYLSSKKAKHRVDELNKKATTNEYWYETATLVD